MAKVMARVPAEDQKEEKRAFRLDVDAAYERVTGGDTNARG